MFQHHSLAQLLDEWFAWANWAAAVGRPHNAPDGPPGHQEFLWAIEDSPDFAWEALLTALHDPRGAQHTGVLAAGPLEEFLSLHGLAFIDRVEAKAKEDPMFAALLSGVWQYTMSDGLWGRVRAAAAAEKLS